MVRVSEEAGEAVEGVIAKVAKDAFETTEKDAGKDAAEGAGRDAGTTAAKQGKRAGKDFTDSGRDKVYEENLERNGGKHKCDYCGQDVQRRPSKSGVPGKPDDAQIDHEYPKSRGGEGSPPNGRVACRRCNRDKSDKTLGDWDDELREWL